MTNLSSFSFSEREKEKDEGEEEEDFDEVTVRDWMREQQQRRAALEALSQRLEHQQRQHNAAAEAAERAERADEAADEAEAAESAHWMAREEMEAAGVDADVRNLEEGDGDDTDTGGDVDEACAARTQDGGGGEYDESEAEEVRRRFDRASSSASLSSSIFSRFVPVADHESDGGDASRRNTVTSSIAAPATATDDGKERRGSGSEYLPPLPVEATFVRELDWVNRPDTTLAFKTYEAPTFRQLRTSFGIAEADYLMSMCADHFLSELVSPGKSGQFFYFTHDMKLMLKTITRQELALLRSLLPHYLEHVERHPRTLLPKLCALHTIRQRTATGSGPKTHFLVMTNVFAAARGNVRATFDIKGSTHGRSLSRRNAVMALAGHMPWKDCDVLKKRTRFPLTSTDRDYLVAQLDIDAAFLAEQGVMDYSLLMGIGNSPKSARPRPLYRHYSSYELRQMMRGSTEVNFELYDRVRSLHMRLTRSDLLRQALPDSDSGERLGPDGAKGLHMVDPNELLYVGIIDITTRWSMWKRAELAIKSLWADRSALSAAEPATYARRLLAFIARIVVVRGPDGNDDDDDAVTVDDDDAVTYAW